MRSEKESFSKQIADTPTQSRRAIAWLIALFSFLFVVICGIALIYTLAQVQRIRTEKESELASIAASKVDEIEAWRDERIGDGLRVQKNPLIYDSVQEYLNNSQDQGLSNEIKAWLENIRSANTYSTYYMFDANGKVLFKDAAHPEELEADDIPEVMQAIAKNETTLSDLHLLDDGKQIRIDLIAPVSGQFAHPIAAVLLRIDPNQFLYPLIQSWPINSQSGETVLFRQDGDKVLYLNDLRFVKDSALRLSFPLSSPDLPAAKALRGNLSPYEGIDYRGVAVLAVAKTIPNTNWYMVAKEDSSEVYAEATREGWLAAGTLFIVLLSILTLALTLIRRQRQELVTHLLVSENDKRKLHQKFDLLFDKGNDSIIIFDETGQIDDVNELAINMYGFSREEFTQKHGYQLIDTNNKTNFEEILLKIRQQDGLRLEMIHIKKDGATFPVDISSRYFDVDGKGYYLNIIRDISEQKKNLELIRSSESKYRSLVEHSTDGIFIADANGKFIDVNDHGSQMVGYSRQELMKLGMSDIVASEDKQVQPLRVKELTSSPNKMIVSERVLVRKDSSQIPVEIIAYGLPNGQMQGVVRDISERVKHRKELEDAAERYRQLFDSNPLPLLVYDTETLDFLAINAAAVRYYGYSRTEFLQMKMSVIQEIKTDLSIKHEQGISHGELISFPQKHITHSGEQKNVEVTSHSLVFNGHPASLELVVDVTEKLKAESDLKENLNALQSLINTAPMGIITTDMQGNVTLWSKEAENIFGWSADEIIGKPYPIIPESSLDTVQTIIDRITKLDEKVHYEAERKQKNGTLITVDINATPIRDYRNKIKGMLALVSDVTELKAVEQANQKMVEERYELLTRLRLQFNRMPVGFILTDKELKILDWNPQAEKIFGYSRSEVIGKSQYDLIIPTEQKSRVAGIVDKVTGSYQTEVITHENITKDGHRIIVEWHNTALYDENSNFIAIMAMAVDVTEKVNAEKQIRESEEKLRAFFESPLVGIIFGDIHGNIFTANDEILKIIGYSRDELEAGQIRWDNLTPPEFRSLDEASIQQAKREGVCTPYEKQYIRKDGKRVWVNVGFILLGEERENSIAYVLDISDRKNAEQSLVESEANYRGLFTHMFNGMAFCKMIYEKDKPANFIYLKTNESFERITGLKNAEGKKVSELIPNIQADNPELFEIYGRVASTGQQEKFESYLPGLEIYFSVFVYSPKQDYFVALFEDVTEQKRAEAEIRSKQELLNMTGAIGKIGGWEIDVLKGTSSWTDEVARIQGLDPSIPASVELGYSLYSPESKPIIEKAVNEAINEGKPYDLELEIIIANGEHKLIRTNGHPELANGRVVKVTGIFQDITELKKTEAEIKKLNDELEQRVKDRTAELLAANQELESFSYSVSHDLRAPIRAIDGFSRIILDEYSNDVTPEVLRYLEIVRANTRNMGTLVDDLLAFSRLGRQSVERQTVNTKRLVNEVVDEIRMANPDRKVEFVIGQLPDCQADVNLLKQVFVNLIANAVKFTRKCENARVEIGAELQSLPNDNKEVEKFTKYCYYVRDNGIGFDMKYYDKLFGVFQRLHKTEDYEGTGVGLAIVKRVIEKHGGKVWAESQLNQGTTFYFVFGETNENGKPD